MKVLLVSSSSGSRGGGEFYFHSLVSGLKDLGHEVILLVSSGPQMDEFAEKMQLLCSVQRFPYINTYLRRTRLLGSLADLRGIRKIRDLLNSFDVDLIHLNKQNLEDGLDLLWAMASSDHPCVATIHVTRSMRALGAVGGGLRDFVALHSLRRCGVPLIGTSRACTEELSEFLTTSKTSIYNIPNGSFQVPPSNRIEYRREWEVSPDTIVLGTVARIEMQKNPLFACALLSRLPQHVHIVWVGDGRMRSDLEKEAQRLGVSERLHLDGWRDDGRSRMSGFDLFFLPSFYEGFPFSLLESKSAGLPAVVSRVDGTSDAIEHDKDGYLCDVGDIDTWTAILGRLIASTELRQRIGEAARQRYIAEFSLEAMARRTVEIYEKVLADHPNRQKR